MLVQIAAGLFIAIVVSNFLRSFWFGFRERVGFETATRIVGVFQLMGCFVAFVAIMGIIVLYKH